MKTTIKLWALALCASMLFFSSCEEDEIFTEVEIPSENQGIQKSLLSDEEKEFVANLKHSALVLTEVLTDKTLLQNIADRIEERPGPEKRLAVNFTELFGNQSSETSRTFSGFQDKFNNTLNSGKYYQSKLYTNSFDNARQGVKDLEKFLTDSNIQIYWPYKQVWDGKSLPTLSYVPLDNEHVNEGFRIVPSLNGGYSIEEVVVDDDYAIENPTWILRQHRPLPESVLKTLQNKENSSARGNARITEVRIAEVRCVEHLDGLFSKGETEIYFVGAETAGSGQAITREIYVELDRYSVRKKKWRTQNKVFDTNWTPEETVNAFIVVDYDKNKKEQTISGNVSYTPKDEEGNSEDYSVTASYSVKVTSERRPLYSNGIHRDWFFERNWSDLGKGLQNGRAVWDAHPVYFTVTVNGFN